MIRRLLVLTAAVVLVATGGLILYRENLGATAAEPGAVAASSAPETAVAPPDDTPSVTTTTIAARPIEIPASAPAGPVPPEPGVPDGWNGKGALTVARGGADLASQPGGEPFMRIREGVVLAGKGVSDDASWVRVFHMCDGTAWVRASEVAAGERAERATVGSGFDFGDAVIVVDPGHGGASNIGAVSQGGIEEKALNAAIAARLSALLREPHTIDWATGEILVGDDVPAVQQVIVTRSGDGQDSDYEAGLDFRAAVANAARAHAMISIHNNAGFEVELDGPGSDVYYQSQVPVYGESRRFATILVEEFRREFAAFDAEWVGSVDLGAKSRLSPRDGVSQYYGILEGSNIPAVIAEGAYLSNPSEAALLSTPEFQHAYAAAAYRALVRFISTDDLGDGPSHDPKVWEGFAGSGSARDTCELPAQHS